jgi:hypothetical protein
MVHFTSVVVLALAAATVNGAPLNKRIAQVIADSTTKWEAACTKAGGADQCNAISVEAFSTLLAAPGPCEQQNAGDKMIDLAKTLNNDPDMIKFAQIFVQQPRNSPNALSVPYCQQAPKNTELNGLFQCQFQGSSSTKFVGGASVGDPGTIPFGLSAPVSPPGSCAANPGGPIKDGSQLVDITSDPGVGAGNKAAASNSTGTSGSSSASCASSSGQSHHHKHHKGKNNNSTIATSTATATASSTDSGTGSPIPTLINLNGGSAPNAAVNAPPSSEASAFPLIKLNGASSPPPATSSTPTDSSAGGYKRAASSSFQLQNGKDAQKLNAEFSTLTASSSCTDGDSACIDKGFAQCSGGKFVVTKCAASTICAALPLVNKPGTSITCTTESDALARIKATGATGGLTGA